MKNFLAALGRRDKQALLALVVEDLEWIIPGEDWPLAGTYRGHAGPEELLQKANETVETSFPQPPEFIAQGDRQAGRTSVVECAPLRFMDPKCTHHKCPLRRTAADKKLFDLHPSSSTANT
jgi:ketosteroid isomerase-like protein